MTIYACQRNKIYTWVPQLCCCLSQLKGWPMILRGCNRARPAFFPARPLWFLYQLSHSVHYIWISCDVCSQPEKKLPQSRQAKVSDEQKKGELACKLVWGTNYRHTMSKPKRNEWLVTSRWRGDVVVLADCRELCEFLSFKSGIPASRRLKVLCVYFNFFLLFQQRHKTASRRRSAPTTVIKAALAGKTHSTKR